MLKTRRWLGVTQGASRRKRRHRAGQRPTYSQGAGLIVPSSMVNPVGCRFANSLIHALFFQVSLSESYHVGWCFHREYWLLTLNYVTWRIWWNLKWNDISSVYLNFKVQALLPAIAHDIDEEEIIMETGKAVLEKVNFISAGCFQSIRNKTNLAICINQTCTARIGNVTVPAHRCHCQPHGAGKRTLINPSCFPMTETRGSPPRKP